LGRQGSSGKGNNGSNNSNAPNKVVVLPPITMNVDNEVYAKTKNTSQSYIRNIASSDPAIATGTEWGTNDVKIYGKRPGVTTITFLDDNTGTNYRVKVTVVKGKQNQVVGGGGGGVVERPGAINRCLVGSWTSQSVSNNFAHWDNGGSGIVMTIDAQGRVSINYDRSQPNIYNTRTTTWSGRASGRVATNGNQGLNVVSVDGSNVMSKATFSNGAAPFTGPLPGLGNVLQNAPTYAYTCDDSSMTLKSNIFSSVWRRNR